LSNAQTFHKTLRLKLVTLAYKKSKNKNVSIILQSYILMIVNAINFELETY